MPKTFYLAARPETLVSIVINGIFPDSLKGIRADITVRNLQLFEIPVLAVEDSDAKKQNTFILEYSIKANTSDYTIEYLPDKESSSLKPEKLNTSDLTCIYVLNQTAQKRVNNLLNTRSPVNIVIKKDFYETYKPSQSQEVVSEIAEPDEFIVYVKTGDLLASKMQTLVNTVNCVGVMGKGIALAFKRQYPNMFSNYKVRCQKNELNIGKPYLYKEGNRNIVNFPTKNHWKNSPHLIDIEEGLKYLAKNIGKWGITSLAIPPLGCGNGGLDWDDVRPLIVKYLLPLKIPIEIYEPFKPVPEHQKSESSQLIKRTQSNLRSKYFKESPNKHQKQMPNIIYEKTNHEIYAKNRSKTVGTVTIEHMNEKPWLDYIEVNKDWRRQGIGTNLIKKAIEMYPDIQITLIPAEEGYQQNYRYRLNEDVECLVKYCINKGIINKDINCIEPVPKLDKQIIMNT